MEIRKTYKFEYGNGLHGTSTGFLPEYATEVVEEINVLYPDKGKLLKRISDEQTFRTVILKDGDSQENYVEVEKPEDERPERRLRDAE